MDVPWLLGFVLSGATGLHPSMAELTQPVDQPNTRLTRRRLVLLTAASLIAPALLLSQTVLARDRVDGLAIGCASMLLFLLVVLRIVGLVRQVEEQAAQLAALARHDGLTGMPNRRTLDGELPSWSPGPTAPCTPPRRPDATASSSTSIRRPPENTRCPRHTPVEATVPASRRWQPVASVTLNDAIALCDRQRCRGWAVVRSIVLGVAGF